MALEFLKRLFRSHAPAAERTSEFPPSPSAGAIDGVAVTKRDVMVISRLLELPKGQWTVLKDEYLQSSIQLIAEGLVAVRTDEEQRRWVRPGHRLIESGFARAYAVEGLLARDSEALERWWDDVPEKSRQTIAGMKAS